MSELSKSIIKSIKDEFGDEVLINAGTIKDSGKKIISVTPAIDIALGGGVPEGSWFTITGRPKAGKTTISINFAKNWLTLDLRDKLFTETWKGALKKRI